MGTREKYRLRQADLFERESPNLRTTLQELYGTLIKEAGGQR
jgi:hypothetical protein